MDLSKFKSINDFKKVAAEKMDPYAYDYLAGGAEDHRTLNRNIDAFSHFQIRPRRLVDVSKIDMSINLFGRKWKSPIILSPIGVQALFHPEGEIGTAKAANEQGHLMIASTVSNFSYQEIAAVSNVKPWFQLYPTTNLEARKTLIHRAEENGCEVLVLTIDIPTVGNREKHAKMLTDNVHGRSGTMGNLKGLLKPEDIFHDNTMTWEIISWIRAQTNMKLILKGILGYEDALLAAEYGVDGIIVSNHGGRQLESDTSTIEVLQEVVNAVDGKIPVFMDGGIRRGTDILKALALGAKAVCIGRAFCYGLSAFGQSGVARVLEILREELERNMRLTGVTKIDSLNTGFIRKKQW